MGRDVPPRVTYWTGTWDPRQEAISKEINTLRSGTRASAPVVAFSSANVTRLVTRERAVTLSHRRWGMLRVIAAAVEPLGHVTHVFGGQSSWHLIRALGRRPIVLTAVVAGQPGQALPHTKLSRVVVETEDQADEWLSLKIPAERMELVRPGIDLTWHVPTAPESLARFRLLFASTPSDASEIAARGLPLMIELARQRPDIDLVIPWRQWGDVGAVTAAFKALRPPANVIVSHDAIADMRHHFATTHATLLCFEKGAGKASPNFVLEGLASGRPCLTSSDNSLGALLTRTGGGIVAAPEVAALSAAVDRLREHWACYSERSRVVAERYFDLSVFRASYDRIYRQVAGT